MKRLLRIATMTVALLTCLSLAGCDDVRVYGSVGYSSYSGYGYGGGVGTRVAIGGRIY
jgi:hypothetical protein